MTPGKSESQIQETLDILQEECAEAIVEVSKIRRFGADSVHYKTGMSHKAHLTMELGDVIAMIDILVEQGLVTREQLELAATQKKHKLTQWSNIYGKD
jgi:NTP pyrophosphatase (non-canonical NTP hydrolase)